MFEIQLRISGLSQATQLMMDMPGNCGRARTSALKSCGYMVQTELRRFIESGGAGWARLHPITTALRKSARSKGPLWWLGRFSRYRVSSDGTRISIGLGKSRTGEPGQTDDPWLTSAALRAEEGAETHVTAGIRRKWLAANRRRTRRHIRSGGYVDRMWFVLRPETGVLKTPARPIFAPVFRNVESRIGPHFESRFWTALDAYSAGRSPRQIKDN